MIKTTMMKKYEHFRILPSAHLFVILRFGQHISSAIIVAFNGIKHIGPFHTCNQLRKTLQTKPAPAYKREKCVHKTNVCDMQERGVQPISMVVTKLLLGSRIIQMKA